MPNRLQYETSPYLLQHAQNPVDWYPWGEAAFDQAKLTNRPVLLSIGYAACHWCHVMEHESFESKAVAAIMNEHFVCIKVDREEHPDVDHLYMDALQAMNGSGGWPLNMFLTPDKLPFYGGTYFPPKAVGGRSSWTDILLAIQAAWEQKPEDIALQAKQLVLHLQQVSLPESATLDTTFSVDDIHQICQHLLQQADKEQGGFGPAPKFPASMNLRFLLNYYHCYKRTNTDLSMQAIRQVELSLDKMIAGGIYDQLGGGFSRYATDSKWLVPHFEKMLYDNALLLDLLSDAYLVTQKLSYRQVIEETLAFCDRELKAPDQEGYYSALDADSEGVEGKFYTWTKAEWDLAASSVHPALADWWGISEKGNWEGTNILYRSKDLKTVLEKHGITEQHFQQELSQAKAILMTERSRRIRPATDDKILLSWNALMNLAMQKAAIALQQPELLKRASAHLDWMLKVFRSPSSALQHVWCKGSVHITAKLDDYAFLIQALIRMAAVSGIQSYFFEAVHLTEEVQLQFSVQDTQFFYFSSAIQKDIVVRKIETYDGACPSANAVMQHNLQELGQLMGRPEWLLQASEMLHSMKSLTIRYPSSFGYWANQVLGDLCGKRQVVVAGIGAEEEVFRLMAHYHPNILFVAQAKEDTLIPALQHKFVAGVLSYYLCKQYSCLAPVYHRTELLQMLAADNV